MTEALETLLLYAPCIPSEQSDDSPLFTDRLYSDFLFGQILECMGMDEERDVKITSGYYAEVDYSLWVYYRNQNGICTECQKFLGTRKKDEPRIGCFLRHIRNAVAHGHFTVIGDMLIGYDVKKATDTTSERNSAVFKIRPIKLVRALQGLNGPAVKEKLLETAFAGMGYTVTPDPMIDSDLRSVADCLLEKNGKRYLFEYKSFEGVRFLHGSHIQAYLSRLDGFRPDAVNVLAVDTSRQTKEVRSLGLERGNFVVLDKPMIERVLNGEDVLAEM